MKSKSNKKKTLTKAFDTAAFADVNKRLPDSRVKIPRHEAVIDAKEFVDENKK